MASDRSIGPGRTTELPMNAVFRFFTRMDARAARAVWISLGLFALVGAVFVIGRFVLDIEPGSVEAWFEQAAGAWYALPATILLFTLLAFVGAPQFALIAAAVFAFGPVQGFMYAWVATMVSATVDFWLGRFLGADVVRRYGGGTVNRISAFVGRNGFWASLIVRIVPSAPFIVVNMAAGVSRMSYLAFIAGAGVGVIPKTALVAFAGGSLIALFSGGNIWAVIMLAVVAVAWIGVMLVARRMLRRGAGEVDEAAPGHDRQSADDSDALAIGDAASHKETSRPDR
ncbi:MAG: TVP38/TMEM64 family protein [Pseudomonadota bacterium]